MLIIAFNDSLNHFFCLDDTESSDDGGTRRRISGFELLNNISAMITHASSRLSDHSSSASRESSESGNVQTTFDKSLAARHEVIIVNTSYLTLQYTYMWCISVFR